MGQQIRLVCYQIAFSLHPNQVVILFVSTSLIFLEDFGVVHSYCIWFFQGKPPDWQDFVGIITLLFINSTISFIEENNAGNAAAALMARLAPKAKVFDQGL